MTPTVSDYLNTNTRRSGKVIIPFLPEKSKEEIILDKEFSFLNDLDEMVTVLRFGLSNLSTVQVAIAEGIVSNVDGGDAIYCTWAYLDSAVEKLQAAVNAAFQEMGVSV